jgi:hypothetical protein
MALGVFEPSTLPSDLVATKMQYSRCHETFLKNPASAVDGCIFN